MKFIIYNSNSTVKLNLKTLIILLLAISFSIQIAFSLKSEDESDEILDASFDSEIEAQIDEESKNLEKLFDTFNFMEVASKNGTAKSKYVIDLQSPTADLSGWLAISNPKFIDPNIFPSESSNSTDSVDFQKVEVGNFIVNKNFPNAQEKEAKNKLMFFSRFKNGVVYFTSAKASMNVLGSLKPVKADDSSIINLKVSATESCLELSDESEMTWTLCAPNDEIKKKWLCSLQQFLKAPKLDIICFSDDSKKPTSEPKKPSEGASHKGKRIQNIIIIPTESRKCNEKWNYLENGIDWECTCSEGLSQSPIDLPSKSASKPTKLKPLFIYDTVLPISNQNSVDGLLVENEPVKIYYKNGALRIFHSYLGKIVASDGGVYHGEEILFHTPSEHTIDGKKFDLEVQIIHYGKSKGDIAKQVVLSFLFHEKPGVFNKFFEKLDYYNLPNQIDDFRDLKERLYIPEIFYRNEENDVNYMKDFSFYTYEGSLPFPPCTERTTYYVASKPIPISSTIVGLFREALRKPDFIAPDGKIVKSDEQPKLNNRAVQPRNGRKILYYQSQLKGLNQ